MTYRDYCQSLSMVTGAFAQGLQPVYVIVGTSEYFVEKTVQFFKKQMSASVDVCMVDIDETTPEGDLNQLALQRDLFSQRSVQVFKGFEKKSKILKSVIQQYTRATSNTALVILRQDKLTVEQGKFLNSYAANTVICVEPNPQEAPTFIKALAKRFDVSIDQSAIAAMRTLFESNYFALENCLAALSALYSDGKRTLNAEDVTNFAGEVHESHVFAIFKELRSGRTSKVQALITDFINRGEKPIAILGILTKYMRDENISKSLQSAFLADIALKTSSCDPAIMLGSVVDSLSPIH